MKPEEAGQPSANAGGKRPPAPALGFELPESKFQPPASRPGIVPRTALVDRLMTEHAPVIAIVAPAGYGKTTLLAQWAERKDSGTAWVSCDSGDNDPAVLLSSLVVALTQTQPLDPGLRRAVAHPDAGITAIPRLLAAVAAMRPVTVMIDHAEAVTSNECLAAVAEFALRLPPGWQLALASRTVLPLPTARLRAQGGIAELSADDLAMGPREASLLLKAAGARVGEEALEELLKRTEGWPAGLYIAALAMKSGSRHGRAGFTFSGDDVFMADYLRAELLDRVSPADRAFLTHTSVLERMSGPLCDAVLGRKRSARLLERIQRRNLLLVPLDRRREWYRYHHLFRDLLQSELRRNEPGLIPDLHFRAAAWFEAHGLPEAAIEHAHAAGDYDRVSRLILELQQPAWSSGRVETVRRWMEWLRDVPSAEYYGAVAVHGALLFASLGQPAEAERWIAAAERAPAAGLLPDGSTMAATLAFLRVNLCRQGPSQMRQDARIAYEGLSPSSSHRATMLSSEGIAYLLEKDFARAAPILYRAFDAASRAGASPLAAVILAEQCSLAAALGRWDEVSLLAHRAVAMVEAGGFEGYFTSALIYAWAARAAVHDADVGAARSWVGRASRLRPLLTYIMPVLPVQALLEMADSYIALADTGGAAAVLAQAHDILAQRPDLGALSGQADRLQSRLATIEAGTPGASSLTAAELRLLPLLSTHLTFREIAERLFVSHHTIRTQAYSIYRKLEVSSRSEAVTRARELGLSAP